MRYKKTLYGNGAYKVVFNEQEEREAKANGFYDPLEVQTQSVSTAANLTSNVVIGSTTHTSNNYGKRRR